jgi:hypothetical protein
MICKTDYFELGLSKKDKDGHTITRCYSLPIDMSYKNHLVCFIKKLMEERIVLANDHLKDIGTRYANAIVKKMEELVPW